MILFSLPSGYGSVGIPISLLFSIILAVIAFIKNRKAELVAYNEKQEKIRKLQEAKAQAAKVEGGNK